MKNIILKSFIGGLTFFFTIFLCIVGYATWMNLTEVQTTDTLTKDRWNEMVTKLNSVGSKVDNLSNIPSGFIGSFYLTSCPTGWKLADGTLGTPDLRGKFIRANITSSTYDPNYTSRTGGLGDINKVGSTQEDAFQDHTHRYGVQHSDNGDGMGYGLLNFASYALNYDNWPVSPTYRTSTETRPKNVALLFCMKE